MKNLTYSLKLKKKKSSGFDEITSKILKAGLSLISLSLSYIYNHLLYTGVGAGIA